ncbi:hypothetical protein C8Q74DRAFT_18089 [Fomes fomentarius]|nr:hypothetical protein C8Q74DRAFT_18089 [Fomes fomentarius]
MRAFAFVAALAALAVSPVVAEGACPGYNFVLQDRGNSWYIVYDDACKGIIEYVYTGTDPCSHGTLHCTPPPTTIDRVLVSGLWYACRGDPAAGSCDGHANTWCCRNDGRRELEEGEVAAVYNSTTGGFTFEKDV